MVDALGIRPSTWRRPKTDGQIIARLRSNALRRARHAAFPRMNAVVRLWTIERNMKEVGAAGLVLAAPEGSSELCREFAASIHAPWAALYQTFPLVLWAVSAFAVHTDYVYRFVPVFERAQIGGITVPDLPFYARLEVFYASRRAAAKTLMVWGVTPAAAPAQ